MGNTQNILQQSPPYRHIAPNMLPSYTYEGNNRRPFAYEMLSYERLPEYSPEIGQNENPPLYEEIDTSRYICDEFGNINCSNCTNCSNCINCYNCSDCRNCINCKYLKKKSYMMNNAIRIKDDFL